MTGFGKSAYNSELGEITIEIKSLNSKNLDISFNIHPFFKSIENEYINEDTSDPHVMKPLIKFGDILEEQGIDPYIQRTTLGSFGEFLVVFDAGSGYELKKVMEAVPHNCLVIAVPDLTYIAKSFISIIA